jgi:O-antigen/teichoic acid export membrane protein
VSGFVRKLRASVTNLTAALFVVPAQVAFFSIARGAGGILDRVPAAFKLKFLPRFTKKPKLNRIKVDYLQQAAQITIWQRC